MKTSVPMQNVIAFVLWCKIVLECEEKRGKKPISCWHKLPHFLGKLG